MTATVTPINWRETPACVGEDPELFFGLDGEPDYKRDEREAEAKKVCARCPAVARSRCLLLALDTESQHGVFGGLGEMERAKHTRRLRRAANAELEKAS
jgi:WhiB family transcriptional regulator, redox-sensing transcriptional regulator